MGDQRSTQHSANGVAGSNNPAANPGQDKPGKPLDGQVGETRPADAPTHKADHEAQQEAHEERKG